MQEKVIYRVDRITDGRTYATRVVCASQGAEEDTCVFMAIISFQSSNTSTGSALDYGTLMPELDGFRPDEIPEDLNRQMMAAWTR